MENSLTVKIKKDDGSFISIIATPQVIDEGVGMVPIGVYDLTSNSLPDIGQLAFHIEDKHQWEYCGDKLSDDEIDQVVLPIQRIIA
ncbi:hypothetical protein ABIB62_002348 [Mucilaginibacter sp. UYP25]|uniref:hypothetical protein n=1 Tax=unclassified Mucilaginibacter TaxID=2617802 RepID=UPI003393D48B